MRTRTGPLVLAVLVVFGLLLGGCTSAPGVSARPSACTDPTVVPDPPGTEGGAQPALMGRAVFLAQNGHLDPARQLFELALEGALPDTRAGSGLAYVQALEQAAENCVTVAHGLAAAGDGDAAATVFEEALELDRGNQEARDALNGLDPTTAEDAAARWDGFYGTWIDPAVRALLPALALLAVLLVVARLMTPLVVPASARAGRPWWHRAEWCVGLALITAVTVLTAVSVVGSARPLESVPADARPVVMAVLVVLFLVVALRARDPRIIVGASVATVVAAGAAWVLTDDDPSRSTWLLLAAGALLGVALHAAGRGHALRLRVQVHAGDKADPDATAYVLARLQDLGTSPPRGLKSPQQLDVTDLPATALSSLPPGRVAAALTPVLGLLLPSIPWRATVDDGAAGRIVVTLTRNGSVAQTAIIDASRFQRGRASSAGEETAPDLGIDRDDLLSGAAAVILTELAERHGRLGAGLCGASRWDSVAAHVVATKPWWAGGAELKRDLLAFAVQRDPRNALAWTAYVLSLGEDATTIDAARAHVGRLTRLRDQVELQQRQERRSLQDGYTPLRLRIEHTLTASWLNLCLAERRVPGAAWTDSWRQAAVAYARLVALLRGTPPHDHLPFVGRLRRLTLPLYEGLSAIRPEGGELVEPDPGWAGQFEALSLVALYDEACTLAVQAREAAGGQTVDGPDEPRGTLLDGTLLDGALARLELAAGLPDLKESARHDPAFTDLREDDGVGDERQRVRWEHFWSIVGDAGPSFTDLPPFGRRGEALRALGVHEPEDLIAATDTPARSARMADRLVVGHDVVENWRAIAELAIRPGAPKPRLSNRELDLLLALGISSGADLAVRTADDAAIDALQRDLAEEARARGVRSPSRTDIDRWMASGAAGRPRPGPVAETMVSLLGSARQLGASGVALEDEGPVLPSGAG